MWDVPNARSRWLLHNAADRTHLRSSPLPPTASDAANVTELTEREGDRYFARISEHVPDTLQQLGTEDLAGRWLTQLTEPVKGIVALLQRFLPETVVAQVCGDGQAVADIKLDTDAIRGATTSSSCSMRTT